MILKFLTALWLSISIGLLVIVSISLYSGYGLDIGPALYEGFEVIPEAVFMGLGFKGSPVMADLSYWVCLVAFFYMAWRGSASE